MCALVLFLSCFQILCGYLVTSTLCLCVSLLLCVALTCVFSSRCVHCVCFFRSSSSSIDIKNNQQCKAVVDMSTVVMVTCARRLPSLSSCSKTSPTMKAMTPPHPEEEEEEE